jgi:hypothetical protein
VPPVAETVRLPPALQVASTMVGVPKIIVVGSLIIYEVDAVQLLASDIVTLYVPATRLLIVGPV